MSDEKSKDEKKGKRMVDTNVRVMKTTHQRMKTLADLWGVTISEAVDLLISQHAPEVDNEIKRREEMQRQMSKKKPSQN